MVSISAVVKILAYSIALIGYAPLSPFLEVVPRFIFPLALIGGFLDDRRGSWLRGPVPTLISLLFFLLYGAQFSKENIVGPAANLLTILLAVRLVSEKNVRNYLQIFALALFSLASSTLFTLQPSFLLYLVLLIVLIAVALVILTFYASDNSLTVTRSGLKTVVSIALLMPAAAVPLMFVFFAILPRTQYPLWNFANLAGSRVAGFSEQVQPGASSSVGETRKAAFRASCEKLAKDQLYWRGAVLNIPAENAWSRGDVPSGESSYADAGKNVHQTVFLEPGKSRYLFALNMPRSITGIRASLTPDFVIRAGSRVDNRVRYDVDSVPGATVKSRRGIDRAFYLQLPRSLSARMLAVGKDIAEKGESDAAKVELLKRFFLAGNIMYATSDLPVSADPLDDFLFAKKRGNCEFFASSFALLLRAAGVPSRLVGGYLGGEYNDLGGYYLVTEDMAHVWVEAYLSEKGWVTIDPSTLSGNFRHMSENRDGGPAGRLRMYMDTFSYYWNVAVVTYDLEKQLQLMRTANNKLKELPLTFHPKKYLLSAAGLFALMALFFAIKRAGVGRISREERILRRLFTLIERKYHCEIDATTGLYELAALTGDPCVEKFAAIYGEAIYHDRTLTAEEYQTLHDLTRALGKRRGKRLTA
jgi:transglutaminase-like putative cysteine protease